MVVYATIGQMLERWEIQSSLVICKSQWKTICSECWKGYDIVHESFLIFIFIFAGWTDPLQLWVRHVKVTYTPIVVPRQQPPSSHPIHPSCASSSSSSWLPLHTWHMFSSSSSPHSPPVCLPLPWAFVRVEPFLAARSFFSSSCCRICSMTSSSVVLLHRVWALSSCRYCNKFPNCRLRRRLWLLGLSW